MDDPSFMGVLHGKCEFQANLSSPIAWYGLCSDSLGKAPTLGVFKDEERIPEVDPNFMNQHDIWMCQRGNRLCLDAEPGEFGEGCSKTTEDQLQGYWTVFLEILSLVNDAHATPTQFADDLVAWNSGNGDFHRSGSSKYCVLGDPLSRFPDLILACVSAGIQRKRRQVPRID